jgi:hypothetical protein
MPFRISYSGPAPLSAYFLKKPIETSAGTEKSLPTSNDNVSEPNIQNGEAGPEDIKNPESEVQYSAAFRGRRVVSHNVRLPPDYVGLLLEQKQTSHSSAQDLARHDPSSGGGTTVKKAVTKAGDRAKALKEKAAAKLNKAGKRKSKYFQDEEEREPQDEGNEAPGGHDVDHAIETGQGQKPVNEQVMNVAGKFDDFTLWHPDGPVDQGRDEYIRSLNEWITLAGEVRIMTTLYLLIYSNPCFLDTSCIKTVIVAFTGHHSSG